MRARPALASAWAWINATLLRQVVGGLGLATLIIGAVVVVGAGDTASDEATGPGRGTTTTSTAAPEPGEPTTTSAAAPSTAPPTIPPPPAPEELRFLPEDQPDGGSVAPLTGLPVLDPAALGRPALAVKIDNLDVPGETAVPQTGLAHADVVVEEVVEGGITRFVAVLHSTDAPEVGPVRSARTTDVNLLPILGRPLFAYSGGNPGVLGAVAASPFLVDRGGEWAPAYVRVGARRAPHNLYLRPWEVWARPDGASTPPVLAPFRPRGTGSPAGEPVRGVDLAFSGAAAARVTWSWLPDHGRWVRHQRGRLHVDGDGYAIGPRNVVVMVTDYGASPADPRSPEAVSVGSGPATVLTDGKAIDGRWVRPSLDAPLVLVDGAGEPITLSSGRTWIEMVRPGTATVIR
ncbi:DUF3048 domain-containing protein [Iamia sp. SCSIO 61187]|uniref:DUF3048 domain-containing protein n=1 Tax=Iamia sp. SCSIO 61187 TaxID=2722752 RepID=UPI001C63AD14|nr:DUF3048 domain-containing protein [Iamia sp. SCSIO 61187]QYG93409.1 DUF3048 domain-containing protein [Iamia sp. SCSIO 61187]